MWTHSSSGRIWGRVGEIITATLQDENFEVDARRCRERTMLLLDYYKKQDFPSLRRLVTSAQPHSKINYFIRFLFFMCFVCFGFFCLVTQIWHRAVVCPKRRSSSWGVGTGGWEGAAGKWREHKVPSGCHGFYFKELFQHFGQPREQLNSLFFQCLLFLTDTLATRGTELRARVQVSLPCPLSPLSNTQSHNSKMLWWTSCDLHIHHALR